MTSEQEDYYINIYYVDNSLEGMVPWPYKAQYTEDGWIKIIGRQSATSSDTLLPVESLEVHGFYLDHKTACEKMLEHGTRLIKEYLEKIEDIERAMNLITEQVSEKH